MKSMLGTSLNSDPTQQFSWDFSNKRDLARGISFVHSNPRASVRAPTALHKGSSSTFKPHLENNRFYRLPQMFPMSDHRTMAFYCAGMGTTVPFSVSCDMTCLPDMSLLAQAVGGQFFSRFTYEKVEDDDAALPRPPRAKSWTDTAGSITSPTRRWDGFTRPYGRSITKDDVFFYVYGLLHCPDYRTRFAADLKKMLPRIPMVADPHPFH